MVKNFITIEEFDKSNLIRKIFKYNKLNKGDYINYRYEYPTLQNKLGFHIDKINCNNFIIKSNNIFKLNNNSFIEKFQNHLTSVNEKTYIIENNDEFNEYIFTNLYNGKNNFTDEEFKNEFVKLKNKYISEKNLKPKTIKFIENVKNKFIINYKSQIIIGNKYLSGQNLINNEMLIKQFFNNNNYYFNIAFYPKLKFKSKENDTYIFNIHFYIDMIMIYK